MPQPIQVQGDGWRGVVHSGSPDGGDLTIRLDSGETLEIPAALLTRRDGSYAAPISLDDLRSAAGRELVIPVIHEELEIAMRKVETAAGVRIRKSAREEEQTVDLPLIREQVEVERVPVDRLLDEPAPVRYVGDTIVVPVMQEVLVVQKQLRLVEELHIRKRRVEEHAPRTITLRKEEATVERLETDTRRLEGGER